MIALTAITVTALAVVAVHIGLTQRIAALLTEIADCYKCSVFWSTLCACFFLYDTHLELSIAIAVIAAYASHFIAVVLAIIHKMYERLCRRLRKPRSNSK
jgi:hypothetical protein